MPGNYIPSAAELFRFSPELLLMVAGTLVMILEAITSPARKRILPVVAFVSLIAALGLPYYFGNRREMAEVIHEAET